MPRRHFTSLGRRSQMRLRTMGFESLENRLLLSAFTSTYSLEDMAIAGDTGRKPQSKVWSHDGQWWSVTPDDTGTWVRRLDGLTWTPVLNLSSTRYRADVKPVGDVAHVLLYKGTSTKLASVQYVPGSPGSYQLWSDRTTLADVTLSSGAEVATIDLDSTGRLWAASDARTDVEVRYSDFPYSTWSDPITVASGISTDDISVVTAMGDNSIGVLWSDQVTERFGFKIHSDLDAPDLWSADEVPASQSALNVGDGMADDHLNVAVASDGTLYAAVKTSYDRAGITRIGLLVRRPSGAWDPLYEVDATQGTRPIVTLSETLGRLVVAYRETDGAGPIVYRESPLSVIAFGPKQTLISGSSVNDPSSVKHSFTDQLVVIAAGGTTLSGGLLSTAALLNEAPSVGAGPDQTIFDVQTANLDGTVGDDGLPGPPATLRTTWTTQSAPVGGAVAFGDPTAVDTTAQFSLAGDYVLRLSADDGELVALDELTITVLPTPINQPPVVDAGVDQTIFNQQVAMLEATVTDDGFPLPTNLTTAWTVQNSPPGGTVTFGDALAIDTTASFDLTGRYALRLTADDGELQTSDELTIDVEQTPQLLTTSLQDGVDGYTGTRDTRIRYDFPTRVFGASSKLEIDGNPDFSSLIQWDLNSIPADSVVFSATITLNVVNASSDVFELYELKRPWVESEATFNQAAAGAPWEVAGAAGPSDRGSTVLGTVTAPATGLATIQLNENGVAIVQSWIANPQANHGLILQDYTNATTNDLDFNSSETSTVANRPILSLTRSPGASENRPPELLPIGDQSVDEGTLLSFTISGTDLDLDPLTYSAAGLPIGASFDAATQTFSFTPAEDRDGTHTVTFSVDDGAASTCETITISVGEGNQPPVLAAIGDQAADEGSPLSFTVTATDADLVAGVPNTLSYSAAGLPIGATFDPATQTFSWTPSEDQDGTYSVTFTVDDAAAADTETITITIGDVNQPPVLAAIGDRAVEADDLLSFTVSATDADLVAGLPNTLTYSAAGVPLGATFDPATQTFSWIPSLAQEGTYSVTFSVDDAAATDSETITITVGEINETPVLGPIGNRAVDEGGLLSFTVSATDAELDPLTYSAAGLPGGASFDPATKTFSWTPSEDQDGTYRVTFSVDDGTSTDFETITIAVGEVNRAPLLAPVGDKAVDEGSLLSFTISATDDDLIAGLPNTLTYSSAGLPLGAVFNPATRTFSWTPSEDQDGSYSVTFTVDDAAATDSETITITVGEVNRAPLLTPVGDKAVGEGSLLSFTISATDDDLIAGLPNILTYSSAGLPLGAVFNPATRTFSWTPSPGQVGAYSVTFTVDDAAATDSETITITVVDSSSPVTQFFQDGVASDSTYAGTRDAKIKAGRPTRNYGSVAELEVDGRPDKATLLKWDLNDVPSGSFVQSVTLTLSVTGKTQHTYEVYELKRDWVESEVTWNEFSTGNGWQIGGAGGSDDRGSTVLASITAPLAGPRTFQLNGAGVAMVQSWINDPAANHGILIENYAGASDGVDFESREAAVATNRPKLSVTYLLGSPTSLRAAGGEVPAPNGVVSLSEEDLQPMIAAALAQLNDAGLGIDFWVVDFVIADLPGSRLGLAESDTIYLDHDAAGYGWFVDATPSDNEEFGPVAADGELRAVDPRAVDRIDLLTVVLHELGHTLGLEDLDFADRLMSGTLQPGVRRVAGAAEIDAILAETP